MGQGLYDLLGFGMIDPPVQVDADGYEIDLEGIERLNLQHAYETEPSYLVVPLAVSDPVLQDSWKLPSLPDWTPRVGPRRVRYVTPPREFSIPVAVRQLWQDVQRIYERAGMVLPEAGIVVLSDWD